MGKRKRKPYSHMFSVIIAAWNIKGTLAAIESLEKQTFKDWELIIVNDNNPDIREYFQNKDLGEDRYFCDMGKRRHWFGAYSRNCGVMYATARFVLFLDDDNLFKPNHLENIYKAYQENPEATMIGVYTEIRGKNMDGKKDPNYKHILKTRVAPQQCDLGSFAYQREMFRKYGYFEGRPERRITYDFELIEKIHNGEGDEKFVILEEPTFIYYHSQR